MTKKVEKKGESLKPIEETLAAEPADESAGES
jgi:hypothetical protein